MAIQKLSAAEVEQHASGTGSAHPEYLFVISSARKCTGGRLVVNDEGVSRQTLKIRLKQAAKVAGRKIKFYRGPATEVVFEVVS